MKIAFTSCFDALKDPKQEVWDRIIEHEPEIFLLLGDSIYMDYFPRLGRPRKWDAQKFADEMYRRYLAQWNVDSFRAFVETVQLVGVTWDDHDFAWNGSCGAGHKEKTKVPLEKIQISRALHLQFKEQLRKRPIVSEYPPQPMLDTMLSDQTIGIEEVLDLEKIRCIMLDGRSFREDPQDDGQTTMLGNAQKEWLLDKIQNWDGLSLVCSGSTLSRSKESWDNYNDYEWLINQQPDRLIVLSGDIHHNAFRRHRGTLNLVEITSSGAALPRIGGDEGNYGVLDIQQDEIKVVLFDEDGPEINKILRL